jgi:hypothetical protein
MTVILDISPDLETRLREKAARRGQVLSDYLLSLAEADSPPLPDASADPAPALFAQWAAEDATDDPEELAWRNREGDELMASLRENRMNLQGRTDFHKLLDDDDSEADV